MGPQTLLSTSPAATLCAPAKANVYPLTLHNKLLKIVASKYGDAEVKVVLNP